MILHPRFDPRRHLGTEDPPVPPREAAPPGAAPPRVGRLRPLGRGLLGALWLRFGFAPTAAGSLALLTCFGASMLGYRDPLGVALATGKWALVLALAAGLGILARKQVRRAIRW